MNERITAAMLRDRYGNRRDGRWDARDLLSAANRIEELEREVARLEEVDTLSSRATADWFKHHGETHSDCQTAPWVEEKDNPASAASDPRKDQRRS